MTTVVCVYVKGHVKFTPDYVTRLANMVARAMDRPYRFVCLTDHYFPTPHRQKVTCLRIPPLAPDVKGWWAKVRLFDASLGLAGRILYLDLDSLVVAPLAPILDYPSPFALVPHGGSFRTRDGLQVLDRFNSSVMVWTAGVNQRLWDEWTPAVTKRLWGDQDHISELMPEADTMPGSWFPRISELQGEKPSNGAKVVLCKKPKNTEAANRYRWVREVWA